MVSYGPAQPLFLNLVVFLAMSWTTVLLRGFVKTVIVKKVTIDDYLMLGAVIVYTAYAASGLVGVVDGPGNPNIGLTPAAVAVTLRSWWICEVLYSPLTLLGRMSVAVFMLRMASQKIHRHIIIGVMVTFWLTTVPLFATLLFQCRPISYFWTQVLPYAPHGHCITNAIVVPVTEIHSAVTAFCDFVLGIMPVVMLWKVKLAKKTKLILSFLLGLGLFAGVALLIRLYYVHQTGLKNSLNKASIRAACWSIIEPGVCIITGCLATLRPLFSSSIRAKQAQRAAQAKSARGTVGRGIWSIRPLIRRMRKVNDRRSDAEAGLLGSPFLNSHEDLELQGVERNCMFSDDENKGNDGRDAITSTNHTLIDVDVAKPEPTHPSDRFAHDIADHELSLQCAAFPLPPRASTLPRLRSLQDIRRERMAPAPGGLWSPHTFPLSFLPPAIHPTGMQPPVIQTGRNFTQTMGGRQDDTSPVNSHGVTPSFTEHTDTQRKVYVVNPDLEAWYGLE